MPLMFTREEIKELLLLEGYGQVSEEVLDRFLSDLKRLVHHEDKKKKERKRLLGLGDGPTSASAVLSTEKIVESSTLISTSSSNSNGGSITSDETDRSRFVNELIVGSDFECSEGKGESDDGDGGKDFEKLKDMHNVQINSDMLLGNKYKQVPSNTTTKSSLLNSKKKDAYRSTDLSFTSREPVPMPINRNIRPASVPVLFKRKKNLNRNLDPNPNERIKWSRVEGALSLSNSSTISARSSRSMCTCNCNRKEKISATSSDYPDDRKFISKSKLDIPMFIRRDPVLLFQFYKGYWDKAKIPGDENHLRLRWNTRQVTDIKPCQGGKFIEYLGPKAKILPKRCSSASAKPKH